MLQSEITAQKIVAIATTLPAQKSELGNFKSQYVCNELQTTSDLGLEAAERIIAKYSIAKESIGILLFGSRTPDYRSPNTAAILQGRLGLSIDCICFDSNVGANGFIKMTHIASALLANSNSEYAMVIVGDTPSKLQNNVAKQKFEESDAATAILIQKSSDDDTIKFESFASGAHFKGSYLKEGGFRNFESEKHFDGSNSSNYIVKSDQEDLNNFFDEVKPMLEPMTDSSSNFLMNSYLINNLDIDDKWQEERKINADASELPILLEILIAKNLISSQKFKFITAGEGMAFMTMEINKIPETLPTTTTSNYFDDYKVSHEM